MKNKSDLHEWRLDLNLITNQYFLIGKIFNDENKRFPDGQIIRTSTVLKIDFLTMTAETKNTVYSLKDMGFNL